MSEPVFAVVGHANPGKSSVVSTLAADDSVRVGALPGTTQHCREFPMRVDDEVLYTLVDTPGSKIRSQMRSGGRSTATVSGIRPLSTARRRSRSMSMPAPSSSRLSSRRPARVAARSVIRPTGSLPFASRSSGRSTPWSIALRTRCRRGSST